MIKSVDVLSDIMSKQGSVSGAQRWVDDLPSDFDTLDVIGEEDEDENEVEPKEKPKEEPKSLFNVSDTEIIKKYGFDPTLKNLPTDEEVKKTNNFHNGQKEF